MSGGGQGAGWDDLAGALARSRDDARALERSAPLEKRRAIEGSTMAASRAWAAAADSADGAGFELGLAAAARVGALAPAAAACALLAKLDGEQAPGKARALREALDAAPPGAFEAWERSLRMLSEWLSPFPGRAGVADARDRAWAWAQLRGPRALALESARAGLGWPAVPAASNFSSLLRGVEFDADPDDSAREARMSPESTLALFARENLLGPALARVGKSGLLQTALRKARSARTVEALCAAGSAEGFAPGASWEGSHPLWVAMRCPLALDGPALLPPMKALMELGFGPNMELPRAMELSRAPSAAAGERPNIALEWINVAPGWTLAGLAELCSARGIDWEARDPERGETALGGLNRLARRPELRAAAEADFSALAALGADPMSIAPARSARSLASTPELRAAAGAAEERAELRAGLGSDASDAAPQASPRAPKRRL